MGLHDDLLGSENPFQSFYDDVLLRKLLDDALNSNQFTFTTGQRQWTTLADLNDALNKLGQNKQAKPKPKVDKPTRIKQIEAELDIIRGVVPTPKGYKIDNTKIKSLMKELKDLKNESSTGKA